MTTKKSVWIDVASLVLGVMLLTVDIPNTWAAVGDGTGFGSESNHYCNNKVNCAPASTCVSGGIVDLPNVKFKIYTNVQATGTCEPVAYSAIDCTKFASYVCADITGYESKDVNNQCQNILGTGFRIVYNGCI